MHEDIKIAMFNKRNLLNTSIKLNDQNITFIATRPNYGYADNFNLLYSIDNVNFYKCNIDLNLEVYGYTSNDFANINIHVRGIHSNGKCAVMYIEIYDYEWTQPHGCFVYRTTDGQNWESIEINYCYDGVFVYVNNLFIIFSSGGSTLYSRDGLVWEEGNDSWLLPITPNSTSGVVVINNTIFNYDAGVGVVEYATNLNNWVTLEIYNLIDDLRKIYIVKSTVKNCYDILLINDYQFVVYTLNIINGSLTGNIPKPLLSMDTFTIIPLHVNGDVYIAYYDYNRESICFIKNYTENIYTDYLPYTYFPLYEYPGGGSSAAEYLNIDYFKYSNGQFIISCATVDYEYRYIATSEDCYNWNIVMRDYNHDARDIYYDSLIYSVSFDTDIVPIGEPGTLIPESNSILVDIYTSNYINDACKLSLIANGIACTIDIPYGYGRDSYVTSVEIPKGTTEITIRIISAACGVYLEGTSVSNYGAYSIGIDNGFSSYIGKQTGQSITTSIINNEYIKLAFAITVEPSPK